MAHDYEPPSGRPEDPKRAAAQALYFTHTLTRRSELTTNDERREVLDALTQQHAERAREELYMQSVRRYYAERRQDLRAAWASYHRQQAERLEQTAAVLVAEHRRRAEELVTAEQKG